MLRARAATAVAVAGACCLLLASGCGSSGESTATSASTAPPSTASASTTTAGAPDGIAAAEQAFAKYTSPQPPVEVKPLPERPPSDKTIAITTCTIPVCRQETDAAKAAAEALGWKVNYVIYEPTPQGYTDSWKKVLADPPDLIAFSGIFPDELVAKEIAQAASMDIPMVAMAPALGKPGPGVAGVVTGSETFRIDGELMADVVAADAKKAEKVVFVNDPAFKALFAPVKAGLVNELQKTCGCTIDQVEVNAAGPDGPRISTIVSYLQSHPDVKYVVAAVGNHLTGVPQALASAGLTDVKLVTRGPQNTDIPLIRGGQILAEVQDENAAAGWRAIDTLARVTVGADYDRNVPGYHAILTKDNLTSDEVPPVPGVPENYLKAWKVQ